MYSAFYLPLPQGIISISYLAAILQVAAIPPASDSEKKKDYNKFKGQLQGF